MYAKTETQNRPKGRLLLFIMGHEIILGQAKEDGIHIAAFTVKGLAANTLLDTAQLPKHCGGAHIAL
jgi:hypothetical protein